MTNENATGAVCSEVKRVDRCQRAIVLPFVPRQLIRDYRSYLRRDCQSSRGRHMVNEPVVRSKRAFETCYHSSYSYCLGTAILIGKLPPRKDFYVGEDISVLDALRSTDRRVANGMSESGEVLQALPCVGDVVHVTNMGGLTITCVREDNLALAETLDACWSFQLVPGVGLEVVSYQPKGQTGALSVFVDYEHNFVCLIPRERVCKESFNRCS